MIEFFSYACPHCAEFEPDLQAWIKRKPKDVEYRVMPMVFREEWKAPAKLYFTLEAMGLVDKYHAQGVRRHPQGEARSCSPIQA